jgi:hypothetical protein
VPDGSHRRSTPASTQDKPSVYDWEEINSNPTEFKEVYEKCQEDSDLVVWICGFCDHKNILEPQELKFARNNSRVVEKSGSEGAKKDPILLIVFDISGSMDEVLGNDQSAYSSLVDRIKKTKVYQRIVSEEEKEISQLLVKQNLQGQGENVPKYKDYLKKNKLLMGLTESLVTDINPSSNEKMERSSGFNANAKKPKLSKTIGFIFFHSNVILEPSNQNEEHRGRVIVCDSHGTFSTRTEGMSRERCNFDDFESLFKMGATYGHAYTTKLSEFQFGNLDFGFGDCSSGQTALGPAIVMAAGVVSQHGPGSSIVVVTDGIGNRGIFDQSEKWEEAQKLLKARLERHKCFLAMLECRNINESNREKDSNNVRTCIDDFCVAYEDSVAKKINILLNKNKTAENLIEDIRKKMNVCINRDNVVWTNQVLLKSQNSCVSFDADMGKLSQKLHNTQALTYIHPKIDSSKLKEKDYMHHFMIQAVVRYENTQSGEQSTFMSYQLRKIIRFNTIRKQTLKKLDNEKTFHDMLEYLSVEEENYDISNMQLGFVKKTFRDTLMFSKSICNRSMRFPLRSGADNKDEQANFFEEIYRKAEKPIEEEDEDDSAL